MMKSENIFDNIESMVAWWIDDGTWDVNDLAQIADAAIEQAVPFVSMPCDLVRTFWPWVESKNIKIMARFDFVNEKKQDFDATISELATKITSTFRQGADGVQILVPYVVLGDFVNAIRVIRNDLFFDKYVSIVIDMDEKQDIDWACAFESLALIKPNSVVLSGHINKFDPNSYFAGRVFDMLQKWNLKSDLHLMFDKNMLRVSQVLRLTEKMRPELMKNMRVFIDKK